MSWACQIYEELCREEACADLEGEVWYECEEWPRGVCDFDDFEEENVQSATKGCGEGSTKRGGWDEEGQTTDVRSLQTKANWTRGELVGPEATGISSEAAISVAEADERCFLCGEQGCDCAGSRPWKEVWSGAAEVVRWAARVRMQQRTVSTVCVGLRGLARSRANFRNNRQKQQAEAKRRREAQEERDERWRKRWWGFVALDYEQKSANRRLVRVAIQTAVQLQTAVQVAEATRQMQEREVAFRRLVSAEQRDKGNQKERKKQGKEGKSEKSEIKKGSYMTEAKHRSVKESNVSPLSYEKKSDVIRLREPKIPW